MRWRVAAPLVSLLVAGCGTAYNSHNEAIGTLRLSAGHSSCASSRLANVLDQARVLDVIPDTRDCEGGEAGMRGEAGCVVPVTTVRLRAPNAVTSASMRHDGWIQAGTPMRIEKTLSGGYAVYLPDADIVDQLDPGACNVFERRVRAGLSAHMAYAAALRQTH
jgi:hypothetical protein